VLYYLPQAFLLLGVLFAFALFFVWLVFGFLKVGFHAFTPHLEP
jgi:hypothetical protein